jgi:hypothetical protein
MKNDRGMADGGELILGRAAGAERGRRPVAACSVDESRDRLNRAG